LGFAFLARGGEFLWRDGVGWDDEKVLRERDLEVRYGCQGEGDEIQDQVWWSWRVQKADQVGEGTTCAQARVPGDAMCPVAAAERIFELYPERKAGEAEDGLPVMRLSGGKPLKRSAIRSLLALAAARMGYPAGRVGVHSLRVGGATALWVATRGNVGLVKRVGRWSSDSVQRYLWDLPQVTTALTRDMVRAKTRVPWSNLEHAVRGR
jgi:hypothetical protein